MVPTLAKGLRTAKSIASSRFSTSISMYPPRCSRVSANGPSVRSRLPSRTRTVVAVDGRMERVAAEVPPLRRRALRCASSAPSRPPGARPCWPFEPGLIEVNQQHVFHGGLHLQVERRGAGIDTRRKLSPWSTLLGANAAVDAVYRSDWGRIVATLIRLVGDFDVAEEAAQEAFAAAVDQWRDLGRARVPARLDHPDRAAQGHRPHPAPGSLRGKARRLRRRVRRRRSRSPTTTPTRSPTIGCG